MDWKRTNMKSYGRTLKFLTWPMRVLFFTMLVVISMATVADAQRFNNGLTVSKKITFYFIFFFIFVEN